MPSGAEIAATAARARKPPPKPSILSIAFQVLTLKRSATMNRDQVLSLIRNILMFAGGVAVSRGWIDNETMLEIVGAAATVGTAIWALIFHAGANKADAVAVATGTATVKQEERVAKAVQ
jgi:hypothetical protein